ncbi:MAG TPA: TIGR03435 family protein [Bryobacteraceae bacterium]|nr:TIGR03435 family protein [Bryobacteraceae bacterium]
MKPFTVCVCLASFASGFALQAQEMPAFEVASIKPSDPNPSNRMFIGMKADAGMVHYTNITLKDCIRAAWRVRDFQIQAPDWMNTAHFEITAKLPTGASMDQIPAMMQGLLAEKFGLTLRHDTREQSVYALVAGKTGPKLQPAAVKADSQPETALGPDGKPRQAVMLRFPPSGVGLHAPSANLATLAEALSRFTARPVVDMTGIDGQYEFDLSFAPETMERVADPRAVPGGTGATDDLTTPSLFDAVQQYGLRLEARKAPVEILTVTHAEKTPAEN